MAEQNVSEHQMQKPCNVVFVMKNLHEIRTRAELSERLTTRGAAVEKYGPHPTLRWFKRTGDVTAQA